MSTRVLEPKDLHIESSVVPQSIDNQYVSADLFAALAGRGGTLRHVLESSLSDRPDRTARRFFEVHKTEYLRSLLYSRQLIVNRAAFWNNPVLIASVLGDDRDGLVSLLASQTIVPFLWNESSFQQPQEFHTLSPGRDAMQRLVGDPALTDITCLRLGGLDSHANAIAADRLATNFRVELQLPLEMSDLRLYQVVDALLDEPQPEATRTALAGRLREVAAWVRQHRPHRSQVYQQFITEGDPTTTPFRTDPFTFELKKWVDAVYNGNLPWALQAHTFTPHGMPTPLDLELSWATVSQTRGLVLDGNLPGALDEIVDRAGRRASLVAWDTLETELAVPLPAPHELSHADVIALRGRTAWAEMMAAMAAHVDTPLDAVRMAEFWAAYDGFLRDLGAWWLARGRPTRDRYAAGVARIFRYGDWFVGLLQIGHQLIPILPAPSVPLPPLTEEFAKITVETGMYLYQRAQVDLRRSQAVRGIQRAQRISTDKLRQTFEAVRVLLPEVAGRLPGGEEQGTVAVDESTG